MTGGVHVAIDQGGHATRASAWSADGTLEGAALVTIATQRNALGHVEHDPDELVGSVETALAEVAHIVEPPRWQAVGLAVQRSSLVCWEKEDGRALSPVLSWQDTRGAAWLRGLSRRAEDVQRLTGLTLSPHYGASKLRWCLDHLPDVRSAAAQSRLAAGPLAAFLLHRLLEERPFLADASTAARTLLWSPFERAWSAELLELFGIPREVLPQSTGTSQAFGTLAFGGRRVPVVVCTGDQSVVPYASGPLDFDAAYVNLGTGAFVLSSTAEALPAPPLLTSLISDDDAHAVLPERSRGTRLAVLGARFRDAFRRGRQRPAAVPCRARERRIPDQGEPGRDGSSPAGGRAARRERRARREPAAVPDARDAFRVAGGSGQQPRGHLARSRVAGGGPAARCDRAGRRRA